MVAGSKHSCHVTNFKVSRDPARLRIIEFVTWACHVTRLRIAPLFPRKFKLIELRYGTGGHPRSKCEKF